MNTFGRKRWLWPWRWRFHVAISSAAKSTSMIYDSSSRSDGIMVAVEFIPRIGSLSNIRVAARRLKS